MSSCTACGGDLIYRLLRFDAVPVHQNLLYATFEAARNCKTGTIDLCACEQCGFVFNSEFDSGLLDYSEDYENSQDKSGSFFSHMRSVADALVVRHSLQGKRVLEIGCGKGGFLDLIVRAANGVGKGFDPSYVNEYDEIPALSFVKDFFPSRQAWWNPDQIICRHVLEHIAQPREFVSMIRNAIPSGQLLVQSSTQGTVQSSTQASMHSWTQGAMQSSPQESMQSSTQAVGLSNRASVPASTRPLYVYFEVPSFDWICENRAFWDIFYEHCNYFTVSSISTLLQRCGFAIEQIATVFAGQYLSVDVVPAPEGAAVDVAPPVLNYRTLASDFNSTMKGVRDQIHASIGVGKKIAIWGAAAKGTTFLNQLNLTPDMVANVIDINPRKHGNYIAGTGQLICAPEFLLENIVDEIYVMNPNYEYEIRQQLVSMSLFPKLIGL